MKPFGHDRPMPTPLVRHLTVVAPAAVPPPDVEIVLDLTRLLSGIRHGAPSDVDRVELAYARTLKTLVPNRLRYAALHPSGRYGRLPAAAVEAFLEQAVSYWETQGSPPSGLEAQRFRIARCWALRPRRIPRATGHRVFLQISPDRRDRPAPTMRTLHAESARFVCMVHGPTSAGFAQPPSPERRPAPRPGAIESLADGIVVDSDATLDALIHQSGQDLRQRPYRVVPLGVDASPAPTAVMPGTPPYFLCIATRAPHRNHQLLINIWRSMVETVGAAHAPRLLLVARHDWQQQAGLDQLERCPTLDGVVQELPAVSEQELRRLRQGACAMLLPSFAEDCGLALAEALAAGVPVLASDIAVHRAAGGSVPEYLDPIDGASWRTAILAYQADASPRRHMQLERIGRWHPVTWSEHLEVVLSLVREVATC